MKGSPAIYKGRIVDKNNFCVFIYSPNGEKKLVKSWDQYEACMQSGVWFNSLNDALGAKAPEIDEEVPQEAKQEAPKVSKPKPKPKPVSKPNNKLKEPPQRAQKVVEDKTVFEVTDENE